MASHSRCRFDGAVNHLYTSTPCPTTTFLDIAASNTSPSPPSPSQFHHGYPKSLFRLSLKSTIPLLVHSSPKPSSTLRALHPLPKRNTLSHYTNPAPSPLFAAISAIVS